MGEIAKLPACAGIDGSPATAADAKSPMTRPRTAASICDGDRDYRRVATHDRVRVSGGLQSSIHSVRDRIADTRAGAADRERRRGDAVTPDLGARGIAVQVVDQHARG